MRDEKMKYDLTWIVNNMEEEYIKENSSVVLELIQYMKNELDRRKEVINTLTSLLDDIINENI